MSAVIERFIVCDGAGNCDGLRFGVDTRQDTIAMHRRNAQAEGWTFSNGKDYCPKCSAARKRKQPTTYESARKAGK